MSAERHQQFLSTLQGKNIFLQFVQFAKINSGCLDKSHWRVGGSQLLCQDLAPTDIGSTSKDRLPLPNYSHACVSWFTWGCPQHWAPTRPEMRWVCPAGAALSDCFRYNSCSSEKLRGNHMCVTFEILSIWYFWAPDITWYFVLLLSSLMLRYMWHLQIRL